METVLILVAVAACVIAGVAVGTLVTRRRAPMRMRSDLDEADEALVLASVAPPPSPIDRTGAVIELAPVEREGDAPPQPRRIAAPDTDAGDGR